MDLHFNKSRMTKCQDVASDNKYDIRFEIRPDITDVVGQPIFPGSITIVTGESGTGKTTFLLQVCNEHAARNRRTGYISGEQNISFLKKICDNCNVKDVDIGNISDVDDICDTMKNYDILVVDSFPCVKCDVSKYGKMTITRRDQFILEKLATQAQQCNCALTIVLHSTKAGEYKGSTFFKHTVDNMITLKKEKGCVVAYLEKSRLAPAAYTVLHMCDGGFSEFYDRPVYVYDDRRFNFMRWRVNNHINNFLMYESAALFKKWAKTSPGVYMEEYLRRDRALRDANSEEYKSAVKELTSDEFKDALSYVKAYFYERQMEYQWKQFIDDINSRLKQAKNIHKQLKFFN